jgi:hypothetical protein
MSVTRFRDHRFAPQMTLLVSILFVSLASCGPSEDSLGIDPSPNASLTASSGQPDPVFPTPEAQGEGEFPLYRDPPVRLTEGRYESPLDTPAEQEAAVQAEQADDSKSKFHGWIQGIFLGTSPYPEELQFRPCDREDIKPVGNPADESILRKSPYWFDPPSYLPPGTFDWTYPYGQMCGSDPAFGIWREFFVDGGGEISIYRTWRRFFPERISKDRVSSGTIAGLPAVIVSPLTPEGAGDTHIIVREASGGTIRVSGFGLPLSEIESVIESLIADVA